MDTVDTKYPVSARIPDWIQIFVKVDTGYRIGYEICLILMDTVSGTGYMYPDIPEFRIRIRQRIWYPCIRRIPVSVRPCYSDDKI